MAAADQHAPNSGNGYLFERVPSVTVDAPNVHVYRTDGDTDDNALALKRLFADEITIRGEKYEPSTFSIDALLDALTDEEEELFDELFALINEKGVFPYEHMTCMETLDEQIDGTSLLLPFGVQQGRFEAQIGPTKPK